MLDVFYKYVHDLLSDTDMLGAKDVSTPLSTSTPLKLNDGTSTVDSEFRQILGNLQLISLIG